MDVGSKIRAAAMMQNFTLSEIAEKMGVTRQAFNDRLKTGKFTDDELKKIGHILGCEWHGMFVLPDGRVIE